MDATTTRLLIARHGNTFDAGDVVLRCGGATDLPLSVSGRQQARRLGCYLQAHYPDLAQVFVSRLRRTRETAELATACLSQRPPLAARPGFNEIDHGPDEGKPETEVMARLGREALLRWDAEGIVPNGWVCDVAAVIGHWQAFVDEIAANYTGRCVLAVTSNGIARFVLQLPCVQSRPAGRIVAKLDTGALASLIRRQDTWEVEFWNQRPPAATSAT